MNAIIVVSEEAMDKNLKQMVIKRMKDEEGFSSRPYRCTSNKLTIGYGRNLEDVGISKEEAEIMLNNDIEKCYAQLKSRIPHIFDRLDRDRQEVLLDMCFNLGIEGLLKFKKMLHALSEDDFTEAAHELMNSRYAHQVPNRAKRNAIILEEGIDCCWGNF